MKAENMKINAEVIIKDCATGAAKGFVGKVGKVQSTCSHNGLYWIDVGNYSIACTLSELRLANKEM
jgi:hypothetical protein